MDKIAHPVVVPNEITPLDSLSLSIIILILLAQWCVTIIERRYNAILKFPLGSNKRVNIAVFRRYIFVVNINEKRDDCCKNHFLIIINPDYN